MFHANKEGCNYIKKNMPSLSSSGESDWRKCNQMGFLFHYYFPRAAQKSLSQDKDVNYGGNNNSAV